MLHLIAYQLLQFLFLEEASIDFFLEPVLILRMRLHAYFTQVSADCDDQHADLHSNTSYSQAKPGHMFQGSAVSASLSCADRIDSSYQQSLHAIVFLVRTAEACLVTALLA